MLLGAGEAFWGKEVTRDWTVGLLRSSVVWSGKCWAHAGKGERLSTAVPGAVAGT